MDFFFVTLFLVVYYIRPQDWVSGLSGVKIVKPIVILGLLALLNRKQKYGLKDFISTPMDWAVSFYAAYCIFTASDSVGTFKLLAPMLAFYWMTLMALDSEEKLLRYMKWWMAMLLAVAGLAVAALYGLDFTNATDRIEFFKGRLCLGTWTHNNPNALGHSVVVAIPLVYFYMFWKSPFKNRLYAVPLIFLAGYAAWHTQSKGSFLVGGGAIVLTLMFGRSKFIQILILSAALAGGGAVMALLPRMSEMNRMSSDEAIMGRMMAWEVARTVSLNHNYGVGYKVFKAYIEWEDLLIPKATHSTYIRLGADLGYPGLLLFLLILWIAFRILISLKTNNLALERARRMLFLIFATYVMSGWMIDRSYHTEYFLLAACCGAVHRLHLKQRQKEEDDFSKKTRNQGLLDNTSNPAMGKSDILEISLPNKLEKKHNLQKWTRVGLLDLVMAGLMLKITLETWDYILSTV
ncbi:MAG: O-antigen ligase family protein [Verrucomicrobiales bacterium]|nr:O-antigen ligase family protein [Verrucomicrobiales bacterium]